MWSASLRYLPTFSFVFSKLLKFKYQCMLLISQAFFCSFYGSKSNIYGLIIHKFGNFSFVAFSMDVASVL